MDESVGTMKKEHINQIGNFETKNNNLNEINENNDTHLSDDSSKLKFRTNPEDINLYRSTYNNNFTFTPQSQLNLNEPYMGGNMMHNYPPNFPTIRNKSGSGKVPDANEYMNEDSEKEE